eukprot:2848196-Prymnesium_polylepis.2
MYGGGVLTPRPLYCGCALGLLTSEGRCRVFRAAPVPTLAAFAGGRGEIETAVMPFALPSN